GDRRTIPTVPVAPYAVDRRASHPAVALRLTARAPRLSCFGVFVTTKRPRDVLAHQRRWVVDARAQRSGDGGIAGRVAEPHRQIAQPALVTDTPNRAAARAFVELRFRPCEQRDEIGIVEAVADSVKVRF